MRLKEIHMLTVHDLGQSHYLWFKALRDAGFPVSRAGLAVDALLGPEPADDDDQVGPALEWRPEADQHFEPSPEDWRDYTAWSDRLEAIDALSAEIGAADRHDAMVRLRRASAGSVD